MSSWREPETDIRRERNNKKNTRVLEPVLKNLMLCKKVYTDHRGRNTYAGEFRTINVNDLPAVCSGISIVTKWGDGQGDRFRQEIRIINPDNSLEIFNSTELEEQFVLDNIYHEHVVSGGISGLFLPQAGRYRVEVYLEGELKGKTYFNVICG
ncbi:MAG: hypothetical protein GF409_03475 [Candidatus Omnitrophica bacterium]|nr:hypothetical protein [Candidatus Omnitrophota bacterium]